MIFMQESSLFVKRAPPYMALSCKDVRKFVALASLFITIDKKAVRLRRSARQARSRSSQGDKKNICNYKDQGPWIHGPSSLLWRASGLAIQLRRTGRRTVLLFCTTSLP